ncbi:MAG: hypothetical protein J6U54_13380 [Clostridiales bacterium]|nr:hypothetical protein [Clostridiales bacterium]
MDEPVKVKYIPVDVAKEYIKQQMWLTADFDEMVEKYGIDVVEYKCCASVSDQEASMLVGYSNFTVEAYAKKRASEWLSECVDKHIKCTGKEREPVYRANEYYFGIMVGEVPKWKQKGEKE